MLKLIKSLLPIGLKKIFAKIISNHFTGTLLGWLYKNKIPFNGVILDTSNTRFVRRKVVSDIFFKIYERAEIDQVRTHLLGDFDVVELGGSIGANTLQIKKKLLPDKKLLSVEASPGLSKILEQNLKLNNLHHNVLVVNRAIDYTGQCEISFLLTESNLSGRVSKSESSDVVKVKTTTLGSIVDEYSLDEFVLISDIEGMEIPIFFEDADSLKKCKQIFLEIDGTEYNGCPLTIDDIIMQVQRLGFNLVEQYYNCVCFERSNE